MLESMGANMFCASREEAEALERAAHLRLQMCETGNIVRLRPATSDHSNEAHEMSGEMEKKKKNRLLVESEPPRRSHQTRMRRRSHTKHASYCLFSILLLLVFLIIATLGSPKTLANCEQRQTSGQQQTTKLAGLASSALAALAKRKAPLAATASEKQAAGSKQIGDWLVHSVAPVLATRIIDNVLQAPSGSAKLASNKKAKSLSDSIDTQALADKIVDRLADGIKRRKNGEKTTMMTTSAAAAAASNALDVNSLQTDGANSGEPLKGKRTGKSLVSDSVQQVMQNLLPLATSSAAATGQRTIFGRAMEKHRQLAQGFGFQQPARSSPSSWSLVGQPKEQASEHSSIMNGLDSGSQLDENPVVLRAEHGHNLTTMSPPTIVHHNHQHQQHQQRQQQQLLMMKQKQQQINKYVHTNRHNQQQQLAPKPWQANGSGGGKRQQSPYSFSPTNNNNNPTSDMNIVQAPSSPPPPTSTTTSTTTTQPTTTTSTSTTTALPPMVFAHQHQHQQQQQHQITQLGANKFKINNRHQYPSSSVAIAPNSWFSSNQPHRFQQSAQHQFGRYPSGLQQQQPTSSSTTSTTTTTTTTSTTPEPPPQTDYVMPPDMMNEELSGGPSSQTTSNAMSSILSSVAQSALETLGSSSASQSLDSDYNPYGQQQQQQQQSHAPTASNSSLSSQNGGGTKGGQASPSTTTARHSVISAEAIPTALGAPLYHLTRNFTVHSIVGPHQMSASGPPRRSSLAPFMGSAAAAASPAAKALAQYFQKGVNNLSSTIFSRQSKGWARRLGLSSVLLSGLLYSAAVLSNPGAPLPTNGAEVLKALSKGLGAAGKKRRTFGPNLGLGPAETAASQINELISSGSDSVDRNAATLMDQNVNLLYQQQPQLVAIIEQLLQQEQQALLLKQQQQQQQQPNLLFSQRSGAQGGAPAMKQPPIEIEDLQSEEEEDGSERRNERRDQFAGAQPFSFQSQQQRPTSVPTSQLTNANVYTIQAMPTISKSSTNPQPADHVLLPQFYISSANHYSNNERHQPVTYSNSGNNLRQRR